MKKEIFLTSFVVLSTSVFGTHNAFEDHVFCKHNGNKRDIGYNTAYQHKVIGHNTLNALLDNNILEHDIDGQDVEGDTELIRSLKYGDAQRAKDLLEQGADPHICNRKKEYPLMFAIYRGLEEIVKLLIDDHIFKEQGIIPLCIAANIGNTDIVSLLLEKYDDVNVFVRNNVSPLMIACYRQHLDIVDLLLKRGALAHFVDVDGNTALMYLLSGDGIKDDNVVDENAINECVDIMLKTTHCRINHINLRTKQTALSIALEKGYNQVAKTLIYYGAELKRCHIDLVSNDVQEYFRSVKARIEKVKSDIYYGNLQDIMKFPKRKYKGVYGVVLPQLVLKSKRIKETDKKELLEFLIDKNGVDVNAGFVLAVALGSEDIVKMLLSRGADVNQKNAHGDTALMISVMHGCDSIAQMILNSKDIDVRAKNNQGKTAKDLARLYRRTNIANMIRSKINKSKMFRYLHSVDRLSYVIDNDETGINEQPKTIVQNNTCADNTGLINLIEKYEVTNDHPLDELYECVEGLLERNWCIVNDVKLKTKDTALSIAVKKKYDSIAQLLIDYGAELTNNLLDSVSEGVLDYYKDIKTRIANLKTDIQYGNLQGVMKFPKRKYKGVYGVILPKLVLSSKEIKETDKKEVLEFLIDKNGVDVNAGFILAVALGAEDVVKMLLSRGADVNQKNAKGDTVLMISIIHRHNSIINMLLDSKDINVSLKNNQGKTVEDLAMLYQRDDIVDMIRQKKNKFVASLGSDGQNINVKAVNNIPDKLSQTNDIPKLESDNNSTYQNNQIGNINNQEINNVSHYNTLNSLLDDDILEYGISKQDVEGDTELIISLKCGNAQRAKELIEQGVDPNICNKDKEYPLMFAIYHGLEEIVKLLIDHGAYVDVVGKFGITPLSVVADTGNVNILSLLLDRKINLNALEKGNISPLMIACYRQHLDIVDLLLKQGAVADYVDICGNTALMYLLEGGGVQDGKVINEESINECVKSFLQSYCGVNYVNHITGNSALSIARDKGYNKVIKTLMDYNAKFTIESSESVSEEISENCTNERNKQGNEQVAYQGYLEVNLLKSVLSSGIMNDTDKMRVITGLIQDNVINVHSKDKSGNTVLMIAILYGGDATIANLLMSKNINVLERNNKGETAEDLAILYQRDDIVDMIRKWKNESVVSFDKQTKSNILISDQAHMDITVSTQKDEQNKEGKAVTDFETKLVELKRDDVNNFELNSSENEKGDKKISKQNQSKKADNVNNKNRDQLINPSVKNKAKVTINVNSVTDDSSNSSSKSDKLSEEWITVESSKRDKHNAVNNEIGINANNNRKVNKVRADNVNNKNRDQSINPNVKNKAKVTINVNSVTDDSSNSSSKSDKLSEEWITVKSRKRDKHNAVNNEISINANNNRKVNSVKQVQKITETSNSINNNTKSHTNIKSTIANNNTDQTSVECRKQKRFVNIRLRNDSKHKKVSINEQLMLVENEKYLDKDLAISHFILDNRGSSYKVNSVTYYDQCAFCVLCSDEQENKKIPLFLRKYADSCKGIQSDDIGYYTDTKTGNIYDIRKDLAKYAKTERISYAKGDKIWNVIAEILHSRIIVYECSQSSIIGFFIYGKNYDKTKRVFFNRDGLHYYSMIPDVQNKPHELSKSDEGAFITVDLKKGNNSYKFVSQDQDINKYVNQENNVDNVLDNMLCITKESARSEKKNNPQNIEQKVVGSEENDKNIKEHSTNIKAKDEIQKYEKVTETQSSIDGLDPITIINLDTVKMNDEVKAFFLNLIDKSTDSYDKSEGLVVSKKSDDSEKSVNSPKVSKPLEESNDSSNSSELDEFWKSLKLGSKACRSKQAMYKGNESNESNARENVKENKIAEDKSDESKRIKESSEGYNQVKDIESKKSEDISELNRTVKIVNKVDIEDKQIHSIGATDIKNVVFTSSVEGDDEKAIKNTATKIIVDKLLKGFYITKDQASDLKHQLSAIHPKGGLFNLTCSDYKNTKVVYVLSTSGFSSYGLSNLEDNAKYQAAENLMKKLIYMKDGIRESLQDHLKDLSLDEQEKFINDPLMQLIFLEQNKFVDPLVCNSDTYEKEDDIEIGEVLWNGYNAYTIIKNDDKIVITDKKTMKESKAVIRNKVKDQAFQLLKRIIPSELALNLSEDFKESDDLQSKILASEQKKVYAMKGYFSSQYWRNKWTAECFGSDKIYLESKVVRGVASNIVNENIKTQEELNQFTSYPHILASLDGKKVFIQNPNYVIAYKNMEQHMENIGNNLFKYTISVEVPSLVKDNGKKKKKKKK